MVSILFIRYGKDKRKTRAIRTTISNNLFTIISTLADNNVEK